MGGFNLESPAAASSGSDFEGIALLSTTEINTGSGSAQVLYTVPVGKAAIITMVVMRGVSTSLAGMGDVAALSWSTSGDYGAAFSDANMGALTDASKVIAVDLSLGTTITRGTAGETFRITFNDPIAGSAKVDVFGYTVDA